MRRSHELIIGSTPFSVGGTWQVRGQPVHLHVNRKKQDIHSASLASVFLTSDSLLGSFVFMTHFHVKVIQAQTMSHDQRCPWHTLQPGKEEVSNLWLESRESAGQCETGCFWLNSSLDVRWWGGVPFCFCFSEWSMASEMGLDLTERRKEKWFVYGPNKEKAKKFVFL